MKNKTERTLTAKDFSQICIHRKPSKWILCVPLHFLFSAHVSYKEGKSLIQNSGSFFYMKFANCTISKNCQLRNFISANWSKNPSNIAAFSNNCFSHQNLVLLTYHSFCFKAHFEHFSEILWFELHFSNICSLNGWAKNMLEFAGRLISNFPLSIRNMNTR